MMETPSSTPDITPDMSGQPIPKKSNTGMIIAIIVIILLCCCCISTIAGWYLWMNGDSLMNRGTSLLFNLL
jgi:hypothetical protein